jgi:dGTP triphosphohydrolase
MNSVIILYCRVAYVARRFAQSLQQQLKKDRERAPGDDKSMYEFDDKEVLCAEIAGLCHDLGISSCIYF